MTFMYQRNLSVGDDLYVYACVLEYAMSPSKPYKVMVKLGRGMCVAFGE